MRHLTKMTAKDEILFRAKKEGWNQEFIGSAPRRKGTDYERGLQKYIEVLIYRLTAEVAGPLNRGAALMVEFTESGSYHSAEFFQSGTTGQKRMTKANVIKYLANGPVTIAARRQRDIEEQAARVATQAAQKAQAQTDASQALLVAQGAVFDLLRAYGLSADHATTVLIAAQDADGPIARLVAAANTNRKLNPVVAPVIPQAGA